MAQFSADHTTPTKSIGKILWCYVFLSAKLVIIYIVWPCIPAMMDVTTTFLTTGKTKFVIGVLVFPNGIERLRIDSFHGQESKRVL